MMGGAHYYFQMATNEGWPEAFGFALSHGSPCIVSWLEDGGSAQQAGLQCGDVLVEVDNEDVREWSIVEVIERARISVKVPPSLIVKSAVSSVSLPRINDGFGITLRGDCPVYIRSVDFDSVGWEVGLRSGDLLIEVNAINVRYHNKAEVVQLINDTGSVLTLTVVKGGLQNQTVPMDHPGVTKNRSKLFHDKVNYFFQHDEQKRVQLLTILRLYNKNRDVESLGGAVDILLETETERRLLRDIRVFLLPNHLPRFDMLVSFEPNVSLSRIHRGLNPSPLLERNKLKKGRSASLPNINYTDKSSRLVVISRDSNGGYGFSLSGNAPVFIRSVDTASPAAMAGLNPKDYILEINNNDVRTATHSHVLRLLKKGGHQPHLLVSQQPPVWDDDNDSLTDHTHLTLPETRIGSFEEQSKAFKQKMNELLIKEEMSSITTELKRFSQQRDLPELVDGLSSVITDKRSSVLFHYICQMLPENSQNEFDNLAATKLAKSIKKHDRKSSKKISSLATVSHSHGDGDGGFHGDEIHYVSDVTQTRKKPDMEEIRGTNDVGVVKYDTMNRPNDEVAVKMKMATRPLPPLPMNGNRSLQATPTNNTTLPSTPQIGVPPPPPTLQGGVGVPPPPPTPLGGVGVPPPPPPPPPPPMGGVIGPGGINRPKTKRVNWDKIQGTNLEGTIWRELSGLEEALEYCELEEQFSAIPTKITTTGQSKDKIPSVLEPRKAYNIAILMGHLKMPSNQIKRAVLSCDTSILSEARLSQMESFAPDKRECLAFSKYHNDSSVLGVADQFSCEMSTIPYYTERLRAMIYKEHFIEKYEEIKSDLQTIITASIVLQNSKKLKKILEIVLKIGNFLNVGSVHSPITAAQGFRIQFLTQLKHLRTTDKKSSLIKYLFSVTEQKYPQIIDFPAEILPVKKAARVSGETLELEVNEIKAGLTDVKHTLNDISSTMEDQLPYDAFIEVMTPFVSNAETQLSQLVQLYSQMKAHFKKVAKFFSEDPSVTKIDEFFASFATFIADFERVEQDVKQQRENESQRQRQREERLRWSKRGSTTSIDNTNESIIDLRDELARKVATRNSRTSDTPPNSSPVLTRQSPPTVLYDKETFF